MTQKEVWALARDGWKGLVLALAVGALAWYFKEWTVAHNTIVIAKYVDHLIIALVLGIIVRAIVGFRPSFVSGFIAAPIIFLPIGILIYGLTDLDFSKLAKIDFAHLALLLIIVVVYLTIIVLLGNLLGLKKQTTYLTATGSSICGAAAMAVTAPAVDAEPEDVSVSLLSVLVAGLVALFFIPLLVKNFNLAANAHALMSGMVLQFTGYVKIATASLGKDLISLASLVKAARYLALLIAIPIFSSKIKGKFNIPWYIYGFVAAGLIASFVHIGSGNFSAWIIAHKGKEMLNFVWAIGLAAIGLNTDIKYIFSINGLKTIVIALAGLIAALLTFFVGNSIIS